MPLPPGKNEHLHLIAVKGMVRICCGNKNIFRFIFRDHISFTGLFHVYRSGEGGFYLLFIARTCGIDLVFPTLAHGKFLVLE